MTSFLKESASSSDVWGTMDGLKVGIKEASDDINNISSIIVLTVITMSLLFYALVWMAQFRHAFTISLDELMAILSLVGGRFTQRLQGSMMRQA